MAKSKKVQSAKDVRVGEAPTAKHITLYNGQPYMTAETRGRTGEQIYGLAEKILLKLVDTPGEIDQKRMDAVVDFSIQFHRTVAKKIAANYPILEEKAVLEAIQTLAAQMKFKDAFKFDEESRTWSVMELALADGEES